MTTAPSTIMPKSIAPRLIRLALTPKTRMLMKLTSMASGMTDAVMSAARSVAEKEKEDDRYQQEAFEEVFLDRLNGSVDHRGLIVERD